MSEAKEKKYLTVPEVAKLCSVSDRTAQRWCEKNYIAAVRTPGGRYRVPLETLRDRADLLGYESSRSADFAGW